MRENALATMNVNRKVPETIPIRPPGYFANCDSKEEIEEQNQLAQASVIQPPVDLE
jgi:hypothetical protein